MAQLTIYIDEGTLGKIESSARREHASISAWVKKRLTGSLAGDWPEGYFDTFGALSGSGFVRPSQPDPAADRRRESL